MWQLTGARRRLIGFGKVGTRIRFLINFGNGAVIAVSLMFAVPQLLSLRGWAGVLVVTGWVACSWLTWGIVYGYFQRQFPAIRYANRWTDMGLAAGFALSGPLGLGVALIASHFCEYGLLWTPRETIACHQLEALGNLVDPADPRDPTFLCSAHRTPDPTCPTCTLLAAISRQGFRNRQRIRKVRRIA